MLLHFRERRMYSSPCRTWNVAWFTASFPAFTTLISYQVFYISYTTTLVYIFYTHIYFSQPPSFLLVQGITLQIALLFCVCLLLFCVLYLQYGTVLRLSYMFIFPNTTYCRKVGRPEHENEFFSVHLISCTLYTSCSERQGLLRRQNFW